MAACRSDRRRWPSAAAALALAALAVPVLAADDARAVPVSAADDAIPGPALEFGFHSRPVSTLGLETLEAVATAADVRVFDPYEGREVVFRALPLESVLDTVYASTWRDEEELLFTCRDGYQPTVPVRRVLEHRAWLALARSGDAGFTIEKLESGRRQRIDLAPFYLIWENLDDPEVRRDGDYGWPYQLVGIDVIRAGNRFPRMAPPESAAPEVARGFREFRIHCSRCHPLNGEGGAIGPELNDAASPAGSRDPAWLRRWIDDPSAINATTRMETLNPALPEREAVIAAIVAYLQEMAETAGDADAPSEDPTADPEPPPDDG